MAMFITVSLIPIFKIIALRIKVMDFPNERKDHSRPVPKIGGLALAMGVLIPSILWLPSDEFGKSILLGTTIIVAFGFVDDIWNLGYRIKFTGQIAAALIVVLFGGVSIKSLGTLLPESIFLPPSLSILLSILVIVGVTNAINLSDGLDGLAGGITMLSFLCISYLADTTGQAAIAVLSIAMAGAIFGFLRFNTYPATVFMGDAGSQLLGFLAITLSIRLSQESAPISPLFPLILLGFPILDTLTVMLERIADGRSPFVADKKHFHHRLMELGLFHTEAVVVIYVLQAFLVTCAFLFRFYSEWSLLLMYAVFSGTILIGFSYARKNRWQIKHNHLFGRLINEKLKRAKEKSLYIRFSFGITRYGLPLLLLAIALIPFQIPPYMLAGSCIMLVVLLSSYFIRSAVKLTVFRIALYLSLPFLLYFSEIEMVSRIAPQWKTIYNLSFAVLAFSIILTLKLTRRQRGFKPTPLDFLILLITLVLPNLIELRIQNFNLMTLTVRGIVFLFGYEILIYELRKEAHKLVSTTALIFMVLIIRGFL